MKVAFNCGCPTRMRMVYDLLVLLGYGNPRCELQPPDNETASALRIDTDTMRIEGKNPRYPDEWGHDYGCVIIDLVK